MSSSTPTADRVAAPPQARPGRVTAAGIVAVMWGGLATAIGLLLLPVAFSLNTFVTVVLVTALVLAVGTLVGGSLVLAGKSPRLLMDVSYISIAVNLVELVVSAAARGGSVFSGTIGVALSGLIVALLTQRPVREHFAAQGVRY